VVGKIGAAEVFPDELLSTFFKATTTSNKIYSPESLLEKINVEKRGRKKIVFTNGCFDLLHPGHVTILEGAKAKGDILVVALNSDLSVEKLKGTGRPILPLKDRARLMAALSCVDYVTSFDEATPEQLIKKLQPDVLIKGGDYQGKEIVGKETVEANGGYVDTIPFEENHSTSALIRKIQFMKGSS
jgi:D-beta-D-heptose 7-phosphate kinase/D-beta-D-heptose 1-phosphate adenosyltransferase